MATVQLDHSWNHNFLHNPSERSFCLPSFQGSWITVLGRMFQQSVGLAMLLVGCVMLITLWLIPLGLPSALVGMAITSANN